ncbi:probable ubiquitin-like-specific protease 2A isoform X2 [Nymphaea colorata]|uniref:probable ubiquitin-like-specific protease 2A isoform X2 n=1 Tax=Nymphaea colorata TaxID=210225 RepID=UPI00129E4EEB|nr:probable ubiquitin-like-specific protease 2A isoform X2 [Nymphaea colorata]
MRSESRKDQSVFDFNAEDDSTEIASIERMRKFKGGDNHRAEDSRLSKYDFLRCFSGDASSHHSEISNVDACSSRKGENEMMDISTSRDCKGLDYGGQVAYEHEKISSRCFQTRLLNLQELRDKQLNCSTAMLEDPSYEAAVDMTSDDDDDECSTGSPLSVSVSDSSENEGEHRCIDGYFERKQKCQFFFEDVKSQEIIVCTDFVRYGDKVCTETLLIFRSDCIKIETIRTSECEQDLHLEVAILDVNFMEWYWVQSVATAYFLVHVTSTAKAEIEKVLGTIGPAKLAFAVSDPGWFEKVQMIMSLSERYGKISKLDYDCLDLSNEMIREIDEFVSEKTMFGANGFSNGISESFEELVFPKGDSDAVSISKRDVELLQPDTFINDTIIDFYIKYLESKLLPEDKDRFHFFNSFFFRKLADLDKNPGSAFEGKVAFQRVRKWTRKVDIFRKDYLFIPVNFNLHWSLIVVCHPGEAAFFKDGKVNENEKVPCILHMDSIKGSHVGLKDLVQSYLWEEWKERHMDAKEAAENDVLRFSDMRFVPLELPQQENSFDCGLFLLHYVELFLKEAPLTFNPFSIKKFSIFLNKGWFPPAEASLKRLFIQKLIYELLEGQPCTNCSTIANDCLEVAKLPEEDSENDLTVELASDRCNPAGLSLGRSLGSDVDSGGVSELLESSTFACAQNVKGLSYGEVLAAAHVGSSCADGQSHSFQHAINVQQLGCIMMPNENETDVDLLGTTYLSTEEANGEPESCTFSSESKRNSFFEPAASELCSTSGQCSMQPKPCADRSVSCESSSGSQPKHDLLEGNFSEKPQTDQETDHPQLIDRLADKPNCESSGNGESTSADESTIPESKENAESFVSCQENLPFSSTGVTEPSEMEKGSPCVKEGAEIEPGDNVVSVDICNHSSVSAADGQEAMDLAEDYRVHQPHHKRMKLMTERRNTRNMGCTPEL